MSRTAYIPSIKAKQLVYHKDELFIASLMLQQSIELIKPTLKLKQINKAQLITYIKGREVIFSNKDIMYFSDKTFLIIVDNITYKEIVMIYTLHNTVFPEKDIINTYNKLYSFPYEVIKKINDMYIYTIYKTYKSSSIENTYFNTLYFTNILKRKSIKHKVSTEYIDIIYKDISIESITYKEIMLQIRLADWSVYSYKVRVGKFEYASESYPVAVHPNLCSTLPYLRNGVLSYCIGLYEDYIQCLEDNVTGRTPYTLWSVAECTNNLKLIDCL
jgi:hypothetical protein